MSDRDRPLVRSPSRDGNIAGAYDLNATLGKGKFAVVRQARHVFTGERVAVKVIDKTKLDEISRTHLYKEVNCMKLVQHPNVVRLFEVIDTVSKLYLILELAEGGDLFDFIQKRGPHGLPEPTAKVYFHQILLAVEYCHKLHVVHRDLKPDNIVFFNDFPNVRLTDFGLSNSFSPGEKLSTSCGSMNYTAPEILLGDSYDGPAGGREPFTGANDSDTITRIMDASYDLPDTLSSECQDLIRQMLQVDPERRPTASQLVCHAWLVDLPEPEGLPSPMLEKTQLTADEHEKILYKMEANMIADRSSIERSLQANKYDSVAGTYYLLAEAYLKKKRQGNGEITPKRLRKKSMPPLGLSPTWVFSPDKTSPERTAQVDASVMRDLNVMESKSPRKRSAVETGVLRPRAATGTQRNRGGLNLLLAESPVLIALPPRTTTTVMMASETQASPALRATTITTTTTLRSSLHTPTTLAEASDESDHECDKTAPQKEASAKKKSVTFRLGDAGATAPLKDKKEEEEEEEEEAAKRRVSFSPRFSPSGRRTGPNKRMLLSTRSSPSLTLGLSMSDNERVKDDDNDDDDEITTLVLSPEIRRSHSPVVRSPPGSLLSPRRVASESPCTFDRLSSSSNKPVIVRKAATLEQVSGGSLDSGMPNGKGSRS